LRNPDVKGLRLPKKLRKRKWKIGAIKKFIDQHVFGYRQKKSEEVTSSRAAEMQTKTPSTNEHRISRSNIDDNEDDDDDDKLRAKSRGMNGRTKEKIKDRTNERGTKGVNRIASERANGRASERANERAKDKMREELFGSAPEAGIFLKFISSLEKFSLCALDLNVVVFFFLLPWLRQLWR